MNESGYWERDRRSLESPIDRERAETGRTQWYVAISAWMTPFEQKCHADLVGRVQDVNPASRIWQRLSKGQSQYIIRVTWNRQSHSTVFRDTRFQQFQVCKTFPSPFIMLERPRPPDVTRFHSTQPAQGQDTTGLCGFDACGWTPYLVFGIDIWWLFRPMSCLFQIYHILKAQGPLWPEVLTILLPYRALSKNLVHLMFKCQ